jgi:hypothetical protein
MELHRLCDTCGDDGCSGHLDELTGGWICWTCDEDVHDDERDDDQELLR